MTRLAYKMHFPLSVNAAAEAPRNEAEVLPLRRVPRITVHAFCDTGEVATTIEKAAQDRRMSRAQISVRTGGMAAAVSAYAQASTPDLVILESSGDEGLLAGLDALAAVCDTGTKVMVIGSSNDIGLYRELLKRGVSEYVQAPIEEMGIISALSSIYADAGAQKFGRICAFMGARGGVGSSTVAQNVAWTVGQRFSAGTILADLDLPFGTAALNYNLEPSHGITDAVEDAHRLDEVMLERLLTKCGEHLSLLSAPALLDRSSDLDADAFEQVLDLAQSMAPYVVLDMPHVWTAWSKKTLLAADEVVITAAPDLASLRNAKHLIDLLRELRPNDAAPRLVLNQLHAPKRPEIKAKEFAKALNLEPLATIPFDGKLFGQAAINGKMISESSPGAKVGESFGAIAGVITGRARREVRGQGLQKILQKLKPARRRHV